MLHLLARKELHGRRMVCPQYTQQSFLHALTLAHFTDVLFWMHHAVSDCLYVTVGTNLAVIDNR